MVWVILPIYFLTFLLVCLTDADANTYRHVHTRTHIYKLYRHSFPNCKYAHDKHCIHWIEMCPPRVMYHVSIVSTVAKLMMRKTTLHVRRDRYSLVRMRNLWGWAKENTVVLSQLACGFDKCSSVGCGFLLANLAQFLAQFWAQFLAQFWLKLSEAHRRGDYIEVVVSLDSLDPSAEPGPPGFPWVAAVILGIIFLCRILCGCSIGRPKVTA